MDAGTRTVRLGTAGWNHADWTGVVYPAGRDVDRLEAVARYVQALEIESTYSAWPAEATVETWARWGHWAGLRFTVLAPRSLTVNPLRAGADDIARLRSLLAPLADAGVLAAVLLQFPQSLHWNRESARAVSEVLARLEPHPCAVELRHESWNVEVVRSWLSRHSVALCNLDQPQLPGAMPPTAWRTAPLTLVRLHGRDRASWFARGPGAERRHDYRYLLDDLRPWAERITRLSSESRETIVIATNHARAAALATVLKLRVLLGQTGLSAPARLCEADPELAALGIEPEAGDEPR